MFFVYICTIAHQKACYVCAVVYMYMFDDADNMDMRTQMYFSHKNVE